MAPGMGTLFTDLAHGGLKTSPDEDPQGGPGVPILALMFQALSTSAVQGYQMHTFSKTPVFRGLMGQR